MTFHFHARAREEYRHAALYYAERGHHLGEEFISRVEQALASVRRFPRARRAMGSSGVRQALLQQFPYALIYLIERDTAEIPCITIYAVAHTKRRPGYWLDRLNPERKRDIDID